LTPFLDDEIAPDARQQMEEHLRGCPACGALLDEVASARVRVHAMGRAIVPDTVLMPALEAFRDSAGIGESRPQELADIPVAAAAGVPVLGEEAPEQGYVEMLSAPVIGPAHVDPETLAPPEPSDPAFPPLPTDPYAGGHAEAYLAAIDHPAAEAVMSEPSSTTYDEPETPIEAGPGGTVDEPVWDLAAAEAAAAVPEIKRRMVAAGAGAPGINTVVAPTENGK